MRAPLALALRYWPGLAFLASAAMLAIAHAFETFGRFSPCELCLRQRDVYWIALPVAALAFLASRFATLRTFAPWLGAVLALIFAGGAVIAGYHAGVEWHFWQGPQACTGGGGQVTAASLSRLLQGAKLAAPRCDEAAWRLLGVSMAGWNCLVSVGLTGVTAAWALAARRP